ncbi:MAG TPA: acylneuraminate cytidylyltransferase family protein [Coxiellaceae bacterium]|nr:acylneuraminate cytidylyltransferase family protein [Coxiellaceae bacterium]
MPSRESCLQKNRQPILAIIPAKGFSRRLPQKNKLLLAGKPMVSYTIMAALNCRLIDKVVVSTDDLFIKQVALREGAEVVDRPSDLSKDKIRNNDVVLHVLQHYAALNQQFNTIVLLQPTSPLRTEYHLTACLHTFLQGEWASGMSVCEVETHPAKAVMINQDAIEPFVDDVAMEAQMQQLPKVYQQNGAIYAVTVKGFLKTFNFYQRPCMAYFMKKEESIDIDNQINFQLAELIMKEHCNDQSEKRSTL